MSRYEQCDLDLAHQVIATMPVSAADALHAIGFGVADVAADIHTLRRQTPERWRRQVMLDIGASDPVPLCAVKHIGGWREYTDHVIAEASR